MFKIQILRNAKVHLFLLKLEIFLASLLISNLKLLKLCILQLRKSVDFLREMFQHSSD